MSEVFICGLGAVSPAGWSVLALREALRNNAALPVHPLAPLNGQKPLSARMVPAASQRPAFLTHPRLRRTSPVTHYAAAAALEALSSFPARTEPGLRLGLVVCLQSGCVQYSSRFFAETLNDPATASPLIFPETVFAAPASHIATLLGNTPLASTLVGDSACFLQGMALAADWLAEGRVGACLVVGAEESHWLSACAVHHFQHSVIISSGAGALCLSQQPALSIGVRLDAITDAHTYSSRNSRADAAVAMRTQLPACSPDELLCDGLGDSARADEPERAAWRDWTGARLSPRRILGEGLMAAAAWQCIAACDAVANAAYSAACVSLVGCNQQALGARFARHAYRSSQ